MRVLLSIKPEFAKKVFEGSKRFEFRRKIFKNPDVKTVVVYASFPVQKVIGEFDIAEIICCKPSSLWKRTKDHAGISKNYFDSYFYDREVGFAISIKDVRKYDEPLCIKKDFNVTPPQSFLYLD